MKFDLTPTQQKKILKFTEEIARDAGAVLLKYAKKLDKLNIEHKSGEGVVSEADFASEKLITNAIQKKFPEHTILAEEMAFASNDKSFGDIKKLGGFTWVIDPLDGTTNFLAGLGYYAVCISLCYQGEAFMGVVYSPTTNEMYSALKGQGAFYQLADKKRQRISKDKSKKQLSDSVVVTGFAAEKGDRVRDEYEAFRNVLEQVRGVRRLGSAALDMCLVARGIFDAYWERGLAPWDVAASSVVCFEAGIKLSDFKGKKFSPFKESFLAARPYIHKKLVGILAQ